MNARRFLFVVLVWFAATAFAVAQPVGEWVHIAASGNAQHFVMPSQARLSPERTIDLWVRTSFTAAQPSGLVRQDALMRFDLDKRQVAFKEQIGYAADGTLLFHAVRPDQKLMWKKIAVESTGEALLDYAQMLYETMRYLASN